MKSKLKLCIYALWATLNDSRPRRPDDQQLDALADSLQTHFTDHGKLIKKEIVKILVPTHNHVKNTFRILDKEVDTTYGQGAAILNKACKEYEGIVFNQMNDFTKAHEATRVGRSTCYSCLPTYQWP